MINIKLKNIIGILAGILTIIAFIPQVIDTNKKYRWDISFYVYNICYWNNIMANLWNFNKFNRNYYF